MARGFRRRRGAIEVRLSREEAAVVRDVAQQLETGVDPGEGTFQRLFPPAYAEDAEAQEEFESLTRDELLAAKRTAARVVIDSIDEGLGARGDFESSLDEERAAAWLGLLNDARLVLGTRLDVTEEMDHTPRASADPEAASFNLYLYLGALQELLLEAMSAG